MNNIIEKIKNDNVLNKILPYLKNIDAYLIGGYLRDLFLGKQSLDRDIVLVCDNIENFVKEIAQKINATFIELDKDWEIYRLVLKDKTNYIDFARAIEKDIKKDILRRDITINAIAFNLNTKEIYDPTNGINDIKTKTIKAISEQNLIDDSLRLLRIFRFQSTLNFQIEEKTYSYLKKHANLLEQPAKERINVELMKLFEGQNTAQTLLSMDDCKILKLIFPFIEDFKKIPKNNHHHLDLFNHLIETVNQIESLFLSLPQKAQEILNENPYGTVKRIAYLKLAAFLHDIGKPQTWTIDEDTGRHRFIMHDAIGAEIIPQYLKTLKFSKKQISYIKNLIRHHIYPSNVNLHNEKSIMKFLRKLDQNTIDVILLAMADRYSAKGVDITEEIIEQNISQLKELMDRYFLKLEELKPLPKLIDGNEIMTLLNIKPSPILGKIIAQIKQEQEDGNISTHDEAIELAKIIFENLNKN